MACKDCKSWGKKVGSKKAQGICHYYPPKASVCLMPQTDPMTGIVQQKMVEITVWPITNPNQWCDKFKPKKAKNAGSKKRGVR